MFNLPEFHAVQLQHCQDLIAAAERERLVQEAMKGQPDTAKPPGLAQGWLIRLAEMLSRNE